MSTDITAALALEFDGRNPPSRCAAKTFVQPSSRERNALLANPTASNNDPTGARARQFFGDPRPANKSEFMKQSDARLERIRSLAAEMDELPL